MASLKSRTYYAILGVSQQAQNAEINKAYKKLALQHHPDKNPGNPNAAVQMQELNEAYQTLSSEDSRSSYDRKLREEANAAAQSAQSKTTQTGSKSKGEVWAENLRRAQAKAEEDRRQRGARERAAREKREVENLSEWLSQLRVIIDRILRLGMQILAAEAILRDIDDKNRETLEEGTEAGNRADLLTSLEGLSVDSALEGYEKKRQDSLERQATQRIKLSWIEDELEVLDGKYETLLARQSPQRREHARRLEVELKTKMNAAALRQATRRKEEEEIEEEELDYPTTDARRNFQSPLQAPRESSPPARSQRTRRPATYQPPIDEQEQSPPTTTSSGPAPRYYAPATARWQTLSQTSTGSKLRPTSRAAARKRPMTK